MPFQTPITVKTALERIRFRQYVLPAIQREFVWSPEQICRLFAANDLDDDVDGRVIEHLPDVVGEHARGQLDAARLRKVADGGAAHHEGRAHLAGEVIAPFEEGMGYPAADDAEADEADSDLLFRTH